MLRREFLNILTSLPLLNLTNNKEKDCNLYHCLVQDSSDEYYEFGREKFPPPTKTTLVIYNLNNGKGYVQYHYLCTSYKISEKDYDKINLLKTKDICELAGIPEQKGYSPKCDIELFGVKFKLTTTIRE